MRTKLHFFIVSVCVIGLSATFTCEAQSKREDRVAVGASLREVLAAWGEPEERVVRGVKQELVWNYKGGARVVFRHGKVVSLRTGEAEQQAQAKRAAAELPKKVVAESEESRDILRDIVREIPSGPDGASPGSPPSSSDPSLAGLIPNAVPPQRGGSPGIAPGVVVPSLDEEEDQ